MEFATLLPQFGNVLLTVVAFVVALSIIVGVHEFGHYIVGRWSGIKAEAFSIGFGPVVFSRVDKHGTKWQLAAVPLGGFVRFAGDANAASGKDADAMEAMPQEELRHTMHGAPLWARAATVAAGPGINFLFSILVFAALILTLGVPSVPPQVKSLYELPYDGLEIAPGDRILAINGVAYPEDKIGSFFDDLPATPVLDYKVQRGSDVLNVVGPQYAPSRIGTVSPRSAGEAAGLMPGDVILKANGADIVRFKELIGVVNGSEGEAIRLDVWRAGEDLEFVIQPERRDIPKPDKSFETRWLIGITSSTFFVPATDNPGLVEAVKLGAERTYDVAALSISALYHMATAKISSCNMSGAIGIARASYDSAEAGFVSFIGFLALLSTAVGFLNLFPIPMLDGGHLVFYAYEAVFRRKPNDAVMNYLMVFGLMFVLSIMLFGLWNDIAC